MWILKWIIADLITLDSDIMSFSLNLVKTRSGSAGVRFAALQAIRGSLAAFENWAFVIMFFVLFTSYVLFIIIKKKRVAFKTSCIPILFVGMFTLFWMMLVKEHFMDHPHFIFRVWAGFAMAMVMLLEDLIEKRVES